MWPASWRAKDDLWRGLRRFQRRGRRRRSPLRAGASWCPGEPTLEWRPFAERCCFGSLFEGSSRGGLAPVDPVGGDWLQGGSQKNCRRGAAGATTGSTMASKETAAARTLAVPRWAVGGAVGGRRLHLRGTPRGKRQRTRTGRGPDAGRTIEFEETDADRTRTGRGRGRFSQVHPPTRVSPAPRYVHPLSVYSPKSTHRIIQDGQWTALPEAPCQVGCRRAAI
eukprot:gene7351-biopygen7544